MVVLAIGVAGTVVQVEQTHLHHHHEPNIIIGRKFTSPSRARQTEREGTYAVSLTL